MIDIVNNNWSFNILLVSCLFLSACDSTHDNSQFYQQGLEVPGTARNETTLLTHSFYPSFNPEGSKLLITDFDVSGRGGFLYVVDVITGARQQLTTGIAGKWSPVDDRILYQCGSQICTILSDGTDRKVLTNDRRASFPSWGPDGKRFVYVRDSAEDNLPGGLWTVDLENETSSFVTRFASSPVWHPNGNLLAFSDHTSTLSGCDLVLYDLKTSSLSVILFSNDNCSITQINFDPKGDRLSFSTDQGIWIQEVHSPKPKKILPFDLPPSKARGREPVLASHSTWSPNGVFIAYERYAVTKFTSQSGRNDGDIYEGIRSVYMVEVNKAIEDANL